METLTTLLGIENPESNPKTLVITIVCIIAFFRIIAIIWTAKDISARTKNHFFQIISILIVTIIPVPIGLLLYIAIRPVGIIIRANGYLNINASGILESSILQNSTRCQKCGTLNPKEYKNCIKCGERLKTTCKECNNEYPNEYHYCPICGAPNIG